MQPRALRIQDRQERLFMLHKCANPDCSRAFRHMGEGKLFVIQASGLSGDRRRRRSKVSVVRQKEYRWLCDECARYMTIAFQRGRGAITRSTTGMGVKPVAEKNRTRPVKASVAPESS